MKSSRYRVRTAFLSCLAALAVAALVAPVYAQPSAAQRDAIAQSCRSDFVWQCGGVTPGGPEALACLQKNIASVSPSCRQAVSAITAAPAAPANQPKTTAAQPAAPAAQPKAATAAQPAKPATQPKTAAAAASAKPKPQVKPKTTPAAAAPAGPAPAAVAEPVPAPTPQQLGAVKFTCGPDFSHYCAGIAPGGPEGLACLQRNADKLTADCKVSVADIADYITTATVPPPATAPATPPAKPKGTKPVAPVASAVVVGRACLRDLALHCRSAGVGEGQKIACLKAYAASGHRLARLCEAALKITPTR